MKTKLFDNPEKIQDHPTGSGIMRKYEFENGYGASVVRFKMPSLPLPSLANVETGHYGSYTSNEKEWELAVLKKDKNNKWELTYDTPITNDVIGHLEKNDVEKILRKIKNLLKVQ